MRVLAASVLSSGARGRAGRAGAKAGVIIMRMVRRNEGAEKAGSVQETEQPGDGEILVEVRPMNPEPAADQFPRQTLTAGW